MRQPRITIARAVASMSPPRRNSSTSAPAMKPFALPERIDEALAAARARARRARASSSAITSADSVLVGRAGLVERQPREAVGVARERPVAPRACAGRSAVRCAVASIIVSMSGPSTSIAPPWPPPMQIDAMPRLPPVRSSTFSTCSTMRAPEAPTGWPSAIAPPSTLSRALVERAERAAAGRARCGSTRRSPRAQAARAPARRTPR